MMGLGKHDECWWIKMQKQRTNVKSEAARDSAEDVRDV
jgi:hypothetical protein